jgi:hypothetical protein
VPARDGTCVVGSNDAICSVGWSEEGDGRVPIRPLFHVATAIPLSIFPLHAVILPLPKHSEEGATSLSFFDEVDETQTTSPRAERQRRPEGGGRRSGGGGRGTSGGGRRPPRSGGRGPADEHAIRIRRGVAAVALLVVVVLVAVGVHSCQVSQQNSALRNYSDGVASIVRASNQTGAQLFSVLSSGQGASNGQNLASSIDEARLSAENQLGRAQALSVPDPAKGAQEDLLLALQMRRDGIANIAQQIQPALQSSTATAAVNQIAAEMARLYASDVLYKDYSLPAIAAALHGAGIAVGGINGEPVVTGQFVPNVQWLTPSFVAQQLHTSYTPTGTTGGGKIAPGTHGHELDSVSAGGTTLDSGSTNTIPANPAPTFTLTFTNSGQNNETNVVCKVTLSGSSDSGQTTVPQTTAGQQATCQVPLGSAPSPGSHTLTATIEPVPGEKDTSNNTQTFPVTFQ